MTTPAETWEKIDRIARVECCFPREGQNCKGYHPQGTRVVYGYEALSKGVRGAIFGSRNIVLDEAIGEISKLVTNDGMVLKSNVLEILNALKLPNA